MKTGTPPILSNIQLMHYFGVNIRICQYENCDVHRGEADVNITIRLTSGLTNPDVQRKRMHQLLCYIYCMSLFS